MLSLTDLERDGGAVVVVRVLLEKGHGEHFAALEHVLQRKVGVGRVLEGPLVARHVPGAGGARNQWRKDRVANGGGAPHRWSSQSILSRSSKKVLSFFRSLKGATWRVALLTLGTHKQEHSERSIRMAGKCNLDEECRKSEGRLDGHLDPAHRAGDQQSRLERRVLQISQEAQDKGASDKAAPGVEALADGLQALQVLDALHQNSANVATHPAGGIELRNSTAIAPR